MPGRALVLRIEPRGRVSTVAGFHPLHEIEELGLGNGVSCLASIRYHAVLARKASRPSVAHELTFGSAVARLRCGVTV